MTDIINVDIRTNNKKMIDDWHKRNWPKTVLGMATGGKQQWWQDSTDHCKPWSWGTRVWSLCVWLFGNIVWLIHMEILWGPSASTVNQFWDINEGQIPHWQYWCQDWFSFKMGGIGRWLPFSICHLLISDAMCLLFAYIAATTLTNTNSNYISSPNYPNNYFDDTSKVRAILAEALIVIVKCLSTC